MSRRIGRCPLASIDGGACSLHYSAGAGIVPVRADTNIGQRFPSRINDDALESPAAWKLKRLQLFTPGGNARLTDHPNRAIGEFVGNDELVGKIVVRLIRNVG